MFLTKYARQVTILIRGDDFTCAQATADAARSHEKITVLTNTVVEALVDLIVRHHFDLNAKHAKDVAAGAVLCAASFAVVVGLLIFVPHLLKLLN